MDYDQIMARRKALTEMPMYAIPAGKMDDILKKIEAETPTSKKRHNDALQLIPGGYQHMLVTKKPYPIFIKKALGTTFLDVDDNAYIDYLMMAGPIMLGHNYPPLIDKVVQVIQDEGIGSGWNSEYEIRASQMIVKHMKTVDQVRFFQSGTEADMAAARVARAYTGKNKIIRIGGAYHGWENEFCYDMHIPYSENFQCQGIPDAFFTHIVSVGPYDLDTLGSAFEQHKDDVAAMIIEPIGCESGAIPYPPDFYQTARDLCDQYGALLIFDEVVTGFRVSMGGAQEYVGVDADLTVMGKVITHGFPSAGALGGRREIMETLGGVNPEKPQPFVAGTMAANAISTSATYWTLKLMEAENAVEKAGQAGDKLTRGLNALFDQMDLPFFAYNFESIIHYETAAPLAMDIREPGAIESALARKAAVDDIAIALLAEGIVTKYGNRAFTSMAHTNEDIDKTLSAFEKVLSLVEQQ